MVAPGWVSQQAFLAGYGATQAMPGPLFTFSAYLGAIEHPSPNGVEGAAIALVAIFLPSFLLLGAALPLWAAARERAQSRPLSRARRRRRRPARRRALGPVLTTSVHDGGRRFAAVVRFLLRRLLPPWAVVGIAAIVGASCSDPEAEVSRSRDAAAGRIALRQPERSST